MKIKKANNTVLFLLLYIALSLLSGCVKVQPWEREYLADRIMNFDEEREESLMRGHFLGTQEGSNGGFGAGGGGCGCN